MRARHLLDGSLSDDPVTRNVVTGKGPYGGNELWNRSLSNVVSRNTVTDNNIPIGP